MEFITCHFIAKKDKFHLFIGQQLLEDHKNSNIFQKMNILGQSIPGKRIMLIFIYLFIFILTYKNSLGKFKVWITHEYLHLAGQNRNKTFKLGPFSDRTINWTKM